MSEFFNQDAPGLVTVEPGVQVTSELAILMATAMALGTCIRTNSYSPTYTLFPGAYSSNVDQEVTSAHPGAPITVRTTLTFDFSSERPQSRYAPPPEMTLEDALRLLLIGTVPRDEAARSPTPPPTRSSSPVDGRSDSATSDRSFICERCLFAVTVIAAPSDCDCGECENPEAVSNLIAWNDTYLQQTFNNIASYCSSLVYCLISCCPSLNVD